MAKIRVMITDDNEDVRRAARSFLTTQEDMEVTGEAENGLEALRLLNEKQADVLLLDMIMPQLDGYGVLEALQRFPAENRPRVIALTALSREDFILRAMRLGVDYYMVKPADMQAVAARVRDAMRAVLPASDPLPFPAAAQSVDDRLSNIFLSLGIPAHIKGYQFLREAVKLVLEDPERIDRITKELYPAIARRFGTSASKVERAIRHAIEVGWSRGRVESLNRAFGCRVAFPEDKPTSGEFIALLADKLSLEQKALQRERRSHTVTK
ncbi:MAG: sporulation transcription factor Spo0A [Clostridia bacterium]|nr:sporulation transcription factor Spo0A [Clostridia bacterium]